MIIDAAELDAAHAYKLLIGSIIPRAVAWVSTVSTEGVANLAPISFFTAVGRKPPMVSITLQPQADGVTLKDTFINIRDTGEFVTNLVTLPQADAMHGSAYGFEPDVDEFEALDLGKEPSEVVRAPRVKDAPILRVRRRPDHPRRGRHGRPRGVGPGGALPRPGRPLPGARPDRHRRPPGRGTPGRRVHAGRERLHHPLDKELLAARHDQRMQRLDGRPADWSPINTKEWSPSGEVRVAPGK